MFAASGARLWAQRVSRGMPPPLRRAASRLWQASADPVVITGWEHPLLPNGSLDTLVWPVVDEAADTTILPSNTTTTLRVILATASLDAGGVDEFVAFLARHLRAAGADVAVMVTDPASRGTGGAIGVALSDEGIDVVAGDAASAEWMKMRTPDVVDVHSGLRWPLGVARSLGAATLITLHGLHDVVEAPRAELIRERQHSDALIAVSEMVRRHYLRLDPDLSPERIQTIPNGVNRARIGGVNGADARRALGFTDEFVFLSLARLSMQKNTFGLLAAFDKAAADNPRAHLVVCGRIDEEDYGRQVMRYVGRMAHGDRVHLRAGTDRISVLLAAADAFVLDSFFEGWSLASMEALGAGLPVVLSDVGGAREQLTDGPHRGILVENPLGDPESVTWARVISGLYRRQSNHEELVQALIDVASGAAGFATRAEIAEYCLGAYSSTKCATRHLMVLEHLAQHRVLPAVVE